MKSGAFLVIGCGLYGAVFANELTKAGIDVLIVEKSDEVGGNIRCERFNGVILHKYGAHIFHTNDKNIWDYVDALCTLTPIAHNPIAISGSGRFVKLPFSLEAFHSFWPDVSTPEQAKKKISEQTAYWREKYPVQTSLEQKALTMVGAEIYEELIKGYTEKQWGAPCDKLPPEIISRIPISYLWNASYYTDKYVGVPEGGYNELITKLVSGCDVITGLDYIKHKDDFKAERGKILFTGCVDELYGYSYGPLDYRSLKFELRIEELKFSQGCPVVNYCSGNIPYTRSIEHGLFVPSKYYEEAVKTYEYPQKYIPGQNIPYYPIANDENKKRYSLYQSLAHGDGILLGGRLGLYRYMDMDDVIIHAMASAKNYINSINNGRKSKQIYA